MDISSTDFGPYSIELKYLKFDRVTRQYTTYDSENESLTAVIDGDLMNVVVLMGNNYFKGVKNITFHREERGDYYASNMLLPAIWDFSPQTEYGYGYYQPVYIFGAPEDVVAYFPDTVNDSLIPSFLSGKPVVEKKKDPGILFHHDPKKGKFTADIVDYDSIHDGFTVLETVSFTVKNENNLKNITVKFPEQILKHIWLDSRPTFHNPSYGTPPVDY